MKTKLPQILLAGLILNLSGCSFLGVVDTIRTSARQDKQRLDAIIQAERAAQFQDAVNEICREAAIDDIIKHFRGNFGAFTTLCGTAVKKTP